MKIYRVTAVKTVEFYIAVRSNEYPFEVAKENVEEAFY